MAETVEEAKLHQKKTKKSPVRKNSQATTLNTRRFRPIPSGEGREPLRIRRSRSSRSGWSRGSGYRTMRLSGRPRREITIRTSR